MTTVPRVRPVSASNRFDRPRNFALDRALDRGIDRAGQPDGVRFTMRQLYYELGRVVLPPPPRPPSSLHVPWWFGAVGPPVPVSYRAFVAAVERRGRDRIPGLLAERPASSPAASQVPESDLLDYGLPQLLVCQHSDTARMLLANDVHLEAACPILGEDELAARPARAASVAAALVAAGDAVVFVLHDASASGLATPGRVRAWFDGTGDLAAVRVVAVGIRPVHARALNLARASTARASTARASTARAGTARASTEPVATLPPGLLPWEVRWLARGRAAELAAVAPDRLLRGVHRALKGQPRGRWAPPDLRAARDLGFLSWPTA